MSAAPKTPCPISRIARRRDILIGQVAYAQTKQAGSVYAATRMRTVKDQTSGESKCIEMSKRVKPWWFADDSGKLCLVVKYGIKLLELARAKWQSSWLRKLT